MERPSKYKTNTKKIIIDCIKSFDKEFSVKDIKNYLSNNNLGVGVATIYRVIDELVESNSIKKIDIDNSNTTYYQYLVPCDCEDHFYLKCNKCGKIIHIDCFCIGDFSKHVLKEHGFVVDSGSILISGLCNDCGR